MKDIWVMYAEREKISRKLVKILRDISPTLLVTNAKASYPVLDYRTAVSMYLEDIVTEMGYEHQRFVDGNRLTKISEQIAA